MVRSNANLTPEGDDKFKHLEKQKQKQRALERASRQKRLSKVEAMRSQVKMLEQFALAVRLAPDADAVWDEFLDDDTKLVRNTLRRLMPVAGELKQLLTEKTQISRLLAEHQLAKKAVSDIMDTIEETDEWDAKTLRWKALARMHFRPMDLSQCVKHIDNALLAMDKFIRSSDLETTGLTFMGWRDSRRLDAASSSLPFSLDKVYRGYDLDHHVNMMWRVYTERELYSRLVLGGRARVSVDILQQISPTICVVRFAEAYDDLPVTVHELYLYF